MKNKVALSIFASLISFAVYSQTYITNVNVVDVVNKKVLSNQTVIITNENITTIVPSGKIKLAAKAVKIDGSGKYLIPGMTDGHVHFFQSGGLYTRPDALDLRKYHTYENEIDWVHANMEDFLLRYLQAGITSVIDVGATYNFLKQRDSLANKKYLPYVYMTGPLLTSYEPDAFKGLKDDEPFKLVTAVDEARKMVKEQLPFKPDFIKIWYIVNPDSVDASAKKYLPVVKAIIEESHKNNLKVAVHATERITAQLAVENGCDYLVHSVEDEIIPDDFVKLLKAKNITLCPTLIVMDGYNKTFGQRVNSSSYELERSNPLPIGSLNDVKHLPNTVYLNQVKLWMNFPKNVAREVRTDSIRKVNLKKLADAGVTIAAGTDAGNIGTQHATSFLEELLAMKKSGLSNWQVIESATINPAKIFNKENSTGSISAGKKADMVLLSANPVDSLENLKKVTLVFKNGKALKADTLIKETPVKLVQRQVNAYNERNIDAFLEPYAEDVEIYTFPDKLIYKGKDNMRKDYSDMFKKLTDLHCEITERIIQGNIIIDKESVSGIEKTKIEGTAIYHIINNKIAKVYFIE